MKKITIEEVFNAARSILNSVNTLYKNDTSEIDYTDSDSMPLGVILR